MSKTAEQWAIEDIKEIRYWYDQVYFNEHTLHNLTSWLYKDTDLRGFKKRRYMLHQQLIHMFIHFIRWVYP